MKKFITSICLILIAVFVISACSTSEEEYWPSSDEFNFSVVFEKKEVARGDDLNFTIKMIRHGGRTFSYRGSPTIYDYQIVSVESGESPLFSRSDGYFKITFPRNYKFEENFSVLTARYEPGEYIFYARFYVREYTYQLEENITITEPTL